MGSPARACNKRRCAKKYMRPKEEGADQRAVSGFSEQNTDPAAATGWLTVTQHVTQHAERRSRPSVVYCVALRARSHRPRALTTRVEAD